MFALLFDPELLNLVSHQQAIARIFHLCDSKRVFACVPAEKWDTKWEHDNFFAIYVDVVGPELGRHVLLLVYKVPNLLVVEISNLNCIVLCYKNVICI